MEVVKDDVIIAWMKEWKNANLLEWIKSALMTLVDTGRDGEDGGRIRIHSAIAFYLLGCKKAPSTKIRNF